jgi:hypothetical protein
VLVVAPTAPPLVVVVVVALALGEGGSWRGVTEGDSETE